MWVAVMGQGVLLNYSRLAKRGTAVCYGDRLQSMRKVSYQILKSTPLNPTLWCLLMLRMPTVAPRQYNGWILFEGSERVSLTHEHTQAGSANCSF